MPQNSSLKQLQETAGTTLRPNERQDIPNGPGVTVCLVRGTTVKQMPDAHLGNKASITQQFITETTTGDTVMQYAFHGTRPHRDSDPPPSMPTARS